MIAADETAEHLAERFHRTYITLESEFPEALREMLPIPWARVPNPNRDLLIAVCGVLLSEDRPENRK